MIKFPKKLSKNRVKTLDCGITVFKKDGAYILKLGEETFSFKTLEDAKITYLLYLYTKDKMNLIEQSICCSVLTSSIRYLPIPSVYLHVMDTIFIYLIDKNIFIRYDREKISVNNAVAYFNAGGVTERNAPGCLTLGDTELETLVQSLWRRMNGNRTKS